MCVYTYMLAYVHMYANIPIERKIGTEMETEDERIIGTGRYKQDNLR